MQNRKVFIFLIIVVFSNSLFSQFKKEEFLYRAKTIYHSLRVQGLENFSCWITSDLFLEETKKTYKDELYPLEIIWKNPNMFYYIKRPIPQLPEIEQNNHINELQINMVQTLKGLIIDWQRFCGGNVLDDLPETYLISTVEDTVFIEYENFENGKPIKVKMLFGLNSICLKISVIFPEKNEIINTYPAFRLAGEKWLCTGWTVQTLKNGSVHSGFVIKLRSKEIENYWIPERMNLQLQTKDVENMRYMRTYIFKNIVLNKDIKFKK